MSQGHVTDADDLKEISSVFLQVYKLLFLNQKSTTQKHFLIKRTRGKTTVKSNCRRM